MRVEQAEVAHLDEERQDGGREREGQPEDQVVEEEALAEEVEMREGEGGGRGDGERQRHRQAPR